MSLANCCELDTMEMMPPNAHGHFDVNNGAGTPPTDVLTELGNHDVVGNGVQGCGVSTPDAADVAVATAGLVRLLHNPNTGILVCAATSAALAIGVDALTGLAVTPSTEGVEPIEHWMAAPAVTIAGISITTLPNSLEQIRPATLPEGAPARRY
jgi:hypothetical protein